MNIVCTNIQLLKNKIMGVMACSRENCENICCENWIKDIGYICKSCLNELKEKHGSNVDFDAFSSSMETPKHKVETYNIDDLLSNCD